MSALGITQLLIPFMVGFFCASISIPPLAYIIYKTVFEAKPYFFSLAFHLHPLCPLSISKSFFLESILAN